MLSHIGKVSDTSLNQEKVRTLQSIKGQRLLERTKLKDLVLALSFQLPSSPIRAKRENDQSNWVTATQRNLVAVKIVTQIAQLEPKGSRDATLLSQIVTTRNNHDLVKELAVLRVQLQRTMMLATSRSVLWA